MDTKETNWGYTLSLYLSHDRETVNTFYQKLFLNLLVVLLYYIMLVFGASTVYAQSDVYLSVRAGGSNLIPVGVGGFEAPGSAGQTGEVGKALSRDLGTSGLFEVRTLPDSLSNAPGGAFMQWQAAGARYYVLGESIHDGDAVRITLVDLSTLLTAFEADYRVLEERPYYTAHVIADDLIEHFTGIRGATASPVAFVRNVGEGDELFLIDTDGRNPRQLTFSRSQNLSPAWSKNGEHIAYSSLSSGNWRIMMLNITTGQSVDITQWEGLNTTPEWSPVEDDLIAFTSSRDGNAELYTCKTNGRDIRRLTNHSRIDTCPAWSPDGSKIVFSSDRTGAPRLYIMNSDGSGLHRLTAIPNAYEDSPEYSPQGDRIVFVVMSDYGFEIASCSSSGDDVVMLTFGYGSNEDPHFSPDGLKIVFTSTRNTGERQLYIMNRDGSNVRPLTIDGKNFSPAWAPTVSGDGIRIGTRK